MNSYAGFRPPKGWSPNVIPGSIQSEEFYNKFVKTRTPVIIERFEEPEFNLNDWTSLPDAVVFVEKRDPTTLTYGTGVKSEIQLRSLFEHFARGEDGLYLTTQPLPEHASGKPAALFGSPLLEMKGKFPLRPRIARHLAPSSINVWIGNSKLGSSSHLHHDFHDNLYLLLNGRKRFTIAPPCDAAAMSLRGSITKIHENGLINYGGTLTRSDGAPIDAVIEFLQSEARNCSQTGPHRSKVQRQLRIAQKLSRNIGVISETGPLDVSECDAGDLSSESESVAGDAAAAADMWAVLSASARVPAARGITSKHPRGSQMPAPHLEKSRVRAELPINPVLAPSAAGRADPPSHFSRIDLPAMRQRLAAIPGAPPVNDMRTFRGIQVAGASLTTFDLEPGQLLYLPAGWFHEVVSFAPELQSEVSVSARGDRSPGDAVDASASVHGAESRVIIGSSAKAISAADFPTRVGDKRRREAMTRPQSSLVPIPAGVHMALNYWFFPPTVEGTFTQPYPDGFAEHLFELAASGLSMET